MTVLFTGKGGKAGSWQIRGHQLGGAIGTVIPRASVNDCQHAEVIVGVKRLGHCIDAIQQSGRPWIWDLVDCYPQPVCTPWTRSECIAWMRHQIKAAQPDHIIWPNRQSQLDCQLPGTVIYHHARPGMAIKPIREKIQTVGYEGDVRYLGRFLPILEAACKARGWHFLYGPTILDDCDVIVALRDDAYNGYAQSHWKSNVKLANAHASGTPFIGFEESAYRETGTGAECWLRDIAELDEVLDYLEPVTTRQWIQSQFLPKTITLASCAEQMRAVIDEVHDG